MASMLLETLFPMRCGICGLTGCGALCERCQDLLDLCAFPLQDFEDSQGTDSISAPVFYRAYGGVCVRRLKFDRRTQLAAPMAQMIYQFAWSKAFNDSDALVPVPLHWLRKSTRGFNQSFLLAAHLGNFTGRPVRENLLKRVRYTRPQSRTRHEHRIANVRGAFQGSNCENMHLVLVDDVYGTGQTVAECARALKRAGAKRVDTVVFAQA
jgi:ComF family protein